MGQPSPRDIVMQTLQNMEEKRITDSYNAPDLPLDVFKSMPDTPRKPPTYSESNPVTGEGTLDAFDAQYNKIQLELNKYIRESGKFLEYNEQNGLWYTEDEINGIEVDQTASEMQSVLNDIYRQAESLQSSLKGSGGASAGAFMDSAAMQADEGDRAYKDYVSRVSDWAALNEADFSREREIANAFQQSQDFTIKQRQAQEAGLLGPWQGTMGFRPPPREEGFNEFGAAIRSTIPSEAPGYVPYTAPNFVPRGYAGGTGGLAMAMQPRVPGQPVGLVKNFTPPPATQMMPPQGSAPVAAGPPMNPPPMEPDLQGHIPMGPAGMTAPQVLERWTNARN